VIVLVRFFERGFFERGFLFHRGFDLAAGVFLSFFQTTETE